MIFGSSSNESSNIIIFWIQSKNNDSSMRDINSFSSRCNFASLFLANNVAKVSQASFGIVISVILCKNSSSIVSDKIYLVLSALIFHFLLSSSFVGEVVSMPPTIPKDLA
ncbi:hypothetical protein Lalb_Chr16g0386081 [Lupinus albus]|uniref:Uncharacterized protein n=1 Tax=Lupinus albus TaxID=3870 RepID=A0A6A4NUT5_LUPAL|nr:hypothetical protein Lalb_Chr16g0386081 [Lupinus albus]